MMRGPVWGGRQAAGKADSQAFILSILSIRYLILSILSIRRSRVQGEKTAPPLAGFLANQAGKIRGLRLLVFATLSMLTRLALPGTLVLLVRCGSALVAPAVGWPAAGRGCTRARLLMSRRHRRAHLQPPGSAPPAAAGQASALEPATLAGVLEDHHYEQFFFDEPTCEALLALMANYERPLLLCTPALAVAAERRGQRYLLLDRDERFEFLSSFRAFDLDAPCPLDEEDEHF